MRVCIKSCIPLVVFPLSFIDYLKSTELVHHLGLLFLATPHHVQSTSDFVNKAKKITLQLGECLTSCDVTALFTSVPIDPALKTIKDLLEKDERLQDRTVLSVQNITDLLVFCLNNTYFSFQNEFYEQVEGAAMGSPVSPTVANLYMNILRGKPSGLPPIPQVLGLGLWMTLG